MGFDEDARAELQRLEAVGRLRTPRVVDGAHGPRITLDGVEVLDFASNDYLSLAGDKRIATAAQVAIDEHGVGAGASRLISGNHRHHVGLERSLADWLRVGGVRVFGSGYQANVGVIAALVGAGDVVLSDALDHASIIDGCRLSRADVVVFPHRDYVALERELSSRPGRRMLVVSETLFSMDGDLADVERLSALCKRYDAALMLDEAHAIGARGPEGRGEAAAAGVVPDVLIGTCGKALGVYGAFAATTPAIAQLLWNRARSFVYSTALPPMVSAAVQASIDIVRGSEGDDRRRTLASHAVRLRERVRDISLDRGTGSRGIVETLSAIGGASDSAIAPLVIGDDRHVMQLSARLFERRVFVQGIRYPTVSEGTARLRLSVTAGHRIEDIDIAAQSLNDALSQATSDNRSP